MSTKKLGRQTPTRSVVLPYTHSEGAQAVAGAASAPDISEEKMVRRMTSTVENITQSFSDDYVETNAKFRSEAGLECYIIRISHNTMGSCCKWCDSLEGKYLYPDDVPKDVYRRHDRCHCTVTYVNNRRGQNVWRKDLGFRKLTDTETEFIKQTGFKKPWMVDYNIGSGIMKSGFKTPHISAEEREQMKIMGFKKPQRLDFSGESGIIEAGSDEVAEIIELGKLNTQPLEEEFGELKTDELIITNERIEHIKLRHPEDFELFEKYGSSVVAEPEFIIKDEKNENTVFVVKKLEDTNLNLVVKVILETEENDLKNSVMTFYRVREKNLKKLINKNKTLYKKE